MEKAYAAWRTFQDTVLAYAAALLLLGCTLLALLEVVRRYVFGFSYEWQQDAVTFFTLSGVFLYFSISQRFLRHVYHMAFENIFPVVLIFALKRLIFKEVGVVPRTGAQARIGYLPGESGSRRNHTCE